MKHARLPDRQHSQVDETALEQLGSHLAELERHIDAGRVKAANKLLGAITRTVDAADFDVPASLRDAMSSLDTRLKELKDWQGFATAPKRVALCERMEVLRDDGTIHPGEKARAIKELQDQWKSLGASDTAEGQQLWRRFKRAADAAFEPCRAYFAEQQHIRERNHAELERVCEALETFDTDTDWRNADWRGVNTVINRARREWRKYEDVPRGKRKSIRKRFNTVLDSLHARLKQEQARNHAIKARIVDQARDLAANESLPVNTRVREIKKLQAEWKRVGITERRTDHRLWKSFRAECDAIFSLRRQGDEHREAAPARDIKRTQPQSKTLMLREAKRKAAICRRLERGDIDRTTAEREWQSDVTVDEGLARALLRRRDEAGNVTEDAMTRNLETASKLCVRMEILAGIDSPPDARPYRAQYQLERLDRELSKGQKETRTSKEQATDIFIEWLKTGPLPEDTGDVTTRFETAAQALLKQAE